MGKPIIFLFDIDGTLILTGGAGRRAFERAFTQLTGSSEALLGFSFGGMTDRAIARAGLSAAGLPFEAATVDALFAAYLAALSDELEVNERYTIMPAVREVVSSLRAEPDVAVGLGTGNLRQGAEAKLQRGELWSLFDFGGFGCDHEDRTELVRLGAVRGAAKLGRPLADCRLVVIGDTVRDVVAAHGASGECIAVGTGGVELETLQQAGADAVFADLAQPSVLARLLAR